MYLLEVQPCYCKLLQIHLSDNSSDLVWAISKQIHDVACHWKMFECIVASESTNRRIDIDLIYYFTQIFYHLIN